ncbi:DUF6801 domain-containing protein [Amycolatopsis nigrescens]|uniref:DUF6801 domain-containing protein n=1 Tax=Amycolatopsis nigrescens TaxID=381445 RepID=UPI00037FAE43|nr:DUF6801 domain-containing protein [Amycolatopsis nigrescens]
MARLARRTARPFRSRWLAGAAVLVSAALLNGGLAGAGPGTPPEPEPVAEAVPVARLLNYDCTSAGAAEPYRISVAISTTAPAWVRAGNPVRLGALDTEVTVPEQALAALGGPAALEGKATLGLTARQGKKETALPVELALAKAPKPDTGPLAFPATATPAAVDTEGAADVEFAVTGLTVGLTLHPAEGEPVPVEPSCAAAADQDPSLTKVSMVQPGAEPPPATGSDSGGMPETVPGLPGSPEAAGREGRTLTGPELLAEIKQQYSPQGVIGTSTVAKINARIKLGPGIAPAVSLVQPGPGQPGDLSIDSALPKTESPFNAFGFMPTTGSVELLPPGVPDGKLTFLTASIRQGLLEIMRAEVVIRLSAVRVNGVPLDVGENCRTVTPVKVAMATPAGGKYTVTAGGPVATIPDSPNPELRSFTIPPFTGCGVTEPLDPLVTGMVSGPGNTIDLDLRTILATAPPG